MVRFYATLTTSNSWCHFARVQPRHTHGTVLRDQLSRTCSGFHLRSNVPYCVLRRTRPYYRSLKHNSLSYAKRNSIRNTENSNASEIRCTTEFIISPYCTTRVTGAGGEESYYSYDNTCDNCATVHVSTRSSVGCWTVSFGKTELQHLDTALC